MYAKVRKFLAHPWATLRAAVIGAEKAAVASASGFVTGAGVGYFASHDWRALLYGVAGAAITGVGTYFTKETTKVAS